MVDRWPLLSSAVAGSHGTRPYPASSATCGIGARVLLCVLNGPSLRAEPQRNQRSLYSMLHVSIVAASGTESIEEFRTRYWSTHKGNKFCRVGLVQLVRFLVMKLIHSCSNSRFDMCVIFMTNYSFSRGRCPCRQRCALGDRLCESQDQSDSVF
jgi:hypothetical protein